MTDAGKSGNHWGSVAQVPTVAVPYITACIGQAERDGVDIQAILHRYDYVIYDGVLSTMSLVDYFRVERDIARALDDLTGHLSTRRLTYKTGEFVLNEIKKSTNLVDAMHSLSSYFNMMHGGTYNSVGLTEKTVTLVTDDADFPYAIPEDRQFVQFVGECVQIKVHCLLDGLSGGLATKGLQKVGIVRPTLGTENEHLSFWPRHPQPDKNTYTLNYNLAVAQESYAQSNGLDLSSEGLLTHVINHLEHNWLFVRQRSCSDKVRELVDQGNWDQIKIADALSISTATLRRRLSEEGETFRGLIEQSRLGRSVTLLDQGMSVQYVSDALSYSDVRAFSRAFKRWRGLTPSQYAIKHRSST